MSISTEQVRTLTGSLVKINSIFYGENMHKEIMEAFTEITDF